MSAPGPRLFVWGTLPSREYLNIVCRFEGLPAGANSVDELLHEMRQMLARGQTYALMTLLERVGIAWREPEARA
jgi:hypothetical protein